MTESEAKETIKQFNDCYGHGAREVLFIAKLRKVPLSNIQLAKVLEVTENTCPHCMDSRVPCTCMRAE